VDVVFTGALRSLATSATPKILLIGLGNIGFVCGRSQDSTSWNPLDVSPRLSSLTPYNVRISLTTTSRKAMSKLSHFDDQGASRMVNVGDKAVTDRVARASGIVRMQASTRQLIVDHGHTKGDVLEVARLAGIMAAKRTADLIPLCHPLALQSVRLDLQPLDDDAIRIEATVEVTGKTGVEMEALTAVSIAALTIYDMCKAVDRGITIEQVQLEEKSGGKSGPYCRK